MRLLLPLGLVLLGVGCAGPHSSGALWSQQNLEQEQASFRLGEARRAELAHAFELSLADEQLASERQRIAADLRACPGARAPLSPSAGDRLRDGIRVQAQGDPARLGQLATLALADWYTRRAAATGDSGLCQRAQQALDGTLGGAESATPDLLAGLPVAIVSRDPSVSAPPAPGSATGQPPLSATSQPSISPTSQPSSSATSQSSTSAATQPPLSATSQPSLSGASPNSLILSSYALGYLDTVQAPSPLPQYLATVYGGHLQAPGAAPFDVDTAQAMVDQAAPAYPQWEPDALYAALRGGAWP